MKQQLSAILFAIIFTAMATPAWATGDESVIIDVRTLDEWNAGHLATAQHLQLDLVAESIEHRSGIQGSAGLSVLPKWQQIWAG